MRFLSNRNQATGFYMVGTSVMKEIKSRPFEDKAAYNKDKNYCVSLFRITKTDYYKNLDHKKIVDNKSFWKYIKRHFTDTSSSFNKITRVERDFTQIIMKKLLKHLMISLLKQFQI